MKAAFYNPVHSAKAASTALPAALAARHEWGNATCAPRARLASGITAR
jgi:hypothetical protein